MKIRNGFVANSSTASFLIAGIDVSHIEDARELYENAKEWFKLFGSSRAETDRIKYFEGDEWGTNGLQDGLELIGVTLFSVGNDEYLEPEQVDIQELLDQVEQIKGYLSFRDRETVFYEGTMSC